MSDIIKLLPDHVANQIAAGEVIQRPSSVVKELLENAIDAGSTAIKLIIREGGKSLIQVIDNGKGMSPSDARMCWERHATSKIKSVEDIFQIKTMGFRGEALASIASIAMVELKTKKAEDQIGTLIRMEASEVKAQEGTATVNGTSITVKNLFFNVPARRNFLKSDAVETRHIMDEFMRVALANPNIAMSMYQNDNETFVLREGDLALRIFELFKLEENTHLLPIKEQTSIVGLSGYVGKPEIAKKTRGEQFFFVNQRYIRDPYLNHALLACYEDLMPKELFPFYVVNIEIDPAQIDVNVHPTKTEIKFEDERAVYQILRAVIKQALGQHYHVPKYVPDSPDTFLNLTGQAPRMDNYRKEGEIVSSPFSGKDLFAKPDKQDWQQLYKVFEKPETIGDMKSDGNFQVEPQKEMELGIETQKHNIIQLHNSVVLVQVKTGLLLIHQQAAHERILFERYLNLKDKGATFSQQKLFPKTLVLNAIDETILNELQPEFKALGFEINSLGKQTFVINAVPADMNEYNEQDLVMTMLQQYKDQAYAAFKPHEKFARILAKRLAIPLGKALSREEMTLLVDELFACKTPNYAPDGSKCFRTLSLDEVFNLFGN